MVVIVVYIMPSLQELGLERTRIAFGQGLHQDRALPMRWFPREYLKAASVSCIHGMCLHFEAKYRSQLGKLGMSADKHPPLSPN